MSGLRLFALYNLNTESLSLPGLSFRADLALPVGALGGEGTRLTVKGIATHSWGLTRVHVNAAATLSPDGASPVAEPPPEWWAGIAVDRTLFRQSLRFVAETVVLHPEGGAASIELNVGGGLRWQWTPTTVVDVGLGRRLRSMGPDISVTLGLTKTFGHSFLRPSRR